MRLSVVEFLGRLLLHVPPPGMQVVRSYGLYAPKRRAALEAAHAAIEPSPEWAEAHRRLTRRQQRSASVATPRCRVCGLALVVRPLAPSAGLPPPAPALAGAPA